MTGFMAMALFYTICAALELCVYAAVRRGINRGLIDNVVPSDQALRPWRFLCTFTCLTAWLCVGLGTTTELAPIVVISFWAICGTAYYNEVIKLGERSSSMFRQRLRSTRSSAIVASICALIAIGLRFKQLLF